MTNLNMTICQYCVQYFMYWHLKEHEYVEVSSKEIVTEYQSSPSSIVRGAISIRLDNKSLLHGRIADSIVAGLESIGGFFESLMHIGLLLVFFFQERLFKSAFIRQLYQISSKKKTSATNIKEDDMVKTIEDNAKLGNDYMKQVLDFIILRRTRFSYTFKSVVQYLTSCLCIRGKQYIKYEAADESHFLYEKGNEKLKRELDIVNLIKSIRQLRLVAQVLLRPRERVMLKFQRKNVIENTSSSSDSDDHRYDPIKLLNKNEGLVKLQQIVKLNKILEQQISKTWFAGGPGFLLPKLTVSENNCLKVPQGVGTLAAKSNNLPLPSLLN